MRWGLHIAGLALIGASLFLLGDNQSWPSAWTAVPVLGAALVVLAGVKDALWARWRLVGLIGRSSYSTYIWHWPLIVALRYEGVRFTPAVIAGGTVLCLLVGLASYWLIERRLTAGLAALPGALRRGLGTAGLVAVVGFATGAAATHGFEAARTAARPPAVLQALRDDRAARDDWIFDAECGHAREAGGLSACRLGDPAARQVLVIGDSHAQMVAARYVHPAGAAGVTFLTRGGRAPVPGVGRMDVAGGDHLGVGVADHQHLARRRIAEAAGRKAARLARMAALGVEDPVVPGGAVVPQRLQHRRRPGRGPGCLEAVSGRRAGGETHHRDQARRPQPPAQRARQGGEARRQPSLDQPVGGEADEEAKDRAAGDHRRREAHPFVAQGDDQRPVPDVGRIGRAPDQPDQPPAGPERILHPGQHHQGRAQDRHGGPGRGPALVVAQQEQARAD